MTMVGAIVKPQLLPKPADAAGNIRARVEFVVGEIDNDKYSTVVKIQTLKDPFSSKWGLSFTLPANQTIESTSRGFVRVVNNTVTVTSDNAAEPEKNMAAIFKITGLFGGEYVLPSATSAVFTST
ncbi:hypothetical protein GQ54DRAFT_298982 [Martensiomyces pterosporus]|nr:hypothetical protein GQ54DRAFT_298982 [Martensiomyces pterosporus]